HSFRYLTSTEIYALSLHDALPILYVTGKRNANGFAASTSQFAASLRRTTVPRSLCPVSIRPRWVRSSTGRERSIAAVIASATARSEEHTSELQSRRDLVCRLLHEKKNGNTAIAAIAYRPIEVERVLFGKRPDDSTIAKAAAHAVDGIEPNSDLVASAE